MNEVYYDFMLIKSHSNKRNSSYSFLQITDYFQRWPMNGEKFTIFSTADKVINLRPYFLIILKKY